jgi:hypothetical protein
MHTCTTKEIKWYLLTNLTESSYLICTLLIEILRFPIIVEIRELSHEFPEDGCKIIKLSVKLFQVRAHRIFQLHPHTNIEGGGGREIEREREKERERERSSQ